jgi:hypothetical protein
MRSVRSTVDVRSVRWTVRSHRRPIMRVGEPDVRGASLGSTACSREAMPCTPFDSCAPGLGSVGREGMFACTG